MRPYLLAATLFLTCAWCFGDICVVLYQKGRQPRKIATCYDRTSFKDIVRQWPSTKTRRIEYWAVPDCVKVWADSTHRVWRVRWNAATVWTLGDSLSADSTYAGRFGE